MRKKRSCLFFMQEERGKGRLLRGAKRKIFGV